MITLSPAEQALVDILGRLKGIADEDLTTAEKQIRDIARKGLGETVAASVRS